MHVSAYPTLLRLIYGQNVNRSRRIMLRLQHGRYALQACLAGAGLSGLFKRAKAGSIDRGLAALRATIGKDFLLHEVAERIDPAR